MIFGSVCSGIEAASVAWHPLGWRAAFLSEIEPFPCAVLAHHYPTVPNLGDMTKFKEWPDAALDVLVGGTPCQSFSVAGLRKGLADPRGNLMLTYLAIAARYKPRWLVWENVPGVLSSNGGRDFASLLRGLEELGYGFAYRILDAQYFGVPQRRRRVFVVGCLGDWRRAAAVLFERHSLSGHPPPRREAGKVAPTIPSRSLGGGGLSTDFDCDGGLISHALRAEGFDASEDGTGRGTPLVPDVAWRLQERDSKGPDSKGPDSDTKPGHLIPVAFSCKDSGLDAGELSPTLRSMGHDGSHANAGGQVAIAFHGSQDPDVSGDITHPVGRNQGRETCVAFDMRGREGGAMLEGPHDTANIRAASGGSSRSYIAEATGWSEELNALEGIQPTLQRGGAGGRHEGVMTPAMQVRRLTPRECERLQGFPDDYTLIQVRNKPAADGPRYKALGNSMAVPVMAWIGKRIEMVEAIK